MNRILKASLLPLVAALVLAGCASDSNFVPRVAPAAPVAFKEDGGARFADVAPAEGQLRGAWWRAFNDPVLDDLVARASANNTNVQTAAARVTDTIKQVGDDGRAVVLTLDRSRLWAVQTPQVFRREALTRALSSAPELISSATDDAWLVEQQGGTVAVLPGSPENFKITTPLDLRLAEMLLRERGLP